MAVRTDQEAGMENHGALSGIVVLDLTRVFCGPLCTEWLGDMGATVIKVERPVTGDDTRQWGPMVNGASAFFANLNRNKYGVTLDLKAPEGKEVFMRLLDRSDVVVENFRAGTMKKLGLSYDVLKERNPRIIFASASGFGSYGPYADRPGYDILAQAMSGIMSLTGHKDGPPTRVGSSIADATTGMNLTLGILAALYNREKTGEGQYLEVALCDSIIGCTTVENMRYNVTGKVPPRNGNHYAVLSPYGAFHAKDRDFIIGCGNQKFYEKFCNDVLHRPELITDERFLTVVDRAKNDDEMTAEVEKWSMTLTAEEAINTLLAAGIPSGPLNDTSDIMKDPHFTEAREMFPYVDHPIVGRQRGTAVPVKFSGTPTTVRKPSPLLGEDNESIYCDMLGMSESELESLKNKNIV